MSTSIDQKRCELHWYVVNINLDSFILFVLQKLVSLRDNREITNSVYDQNNKRIIFNHLSTVFQVGLAGFANNFCDSIKVKRSAVAGGGETLMPSSTQLLYTQASDNIYYTVFRVGYYHLWLTGSRLCISKWLTRLRSVSWSAPVNGFKNKTFNFQRLLCPL